MYDPSVKSIIVEYMPIAEFYEQYAYSAWEPQFADRMKLSSTESNFIVSNSACILLGS
jgi:hypothetical protein